MSGSSMSSSILPATTHLPWIASPCSYASLRLVSPETFNLSDNSTVIFHVQNAELDILLLNCPLSSPSLLWDRTWLCSKDWPGIHNVEQAWIFLVTVPYSAFRELGWQSLATVARLSCLALVPYGLRSLYVFLKVSMSSLNFLHQEPTTTVCSLESSSGENGCLFWLFWIRTFFHCLICDLHWWIRLSCWESNYSRFNIINHKTL